MAECIKKLCHKAFSVTNLPRTTAVVKEPKVADFEPNSATGNRHYVAKIPAPLGL